MGDPLTRPDVMFAGLQHEFNLSEADLKYTNPDCSVTLRLNSAAPLPEVFRGIPLPSSMII